MSELGYGWAVLLGAIQGLTEFLPISSSAHLAIAQRWMGLEPDSLTILLFDVVMHVGTVASIFVVFRAPIRRYFVRLAKEWRGGWIDKRYATRIAVLGVFASIPTAAIGLGFKSFLEDAFNHPRRIGGELIVTGVLLWAMSMVRRGRRGWKDFQVAHAVAIGVAQGISILPGISRSGATICTAAFFGIRRRWAAEFSFFIAIPAILGATAIKVKDAFELGSAAMAALPWGPILAGSAVAFGVGVAAIACLMGAVRRAKMHHFAWYCWIVGALVLFGVV